MLTYYLPKEKARKVKNLLANKQEEEPEAEPIRADEIVSHWHHVGYCPDWRQHFYDFDPELDSGPGLGRR